jgi:hypothetical protein
LFLISRLSDPATTGANRNLQKLLYGKNGDFFMIGGQNGQKRINRGLSQSIEKPSPEIAGINNYDESRWMVLRLLKEYPRRCSKLFKGRIVWPFTLVNCPQKS